MELTISYDAQNDKQKFSFSVGFDDIFSLDNFQFDFFIGQLQQYRDSDPIVRAAGMILEIARAKSLVDAPPPDQELPPFPPPDGFPTGDQDGSAHP
jgi:hypothetical protein